MLKQVRGQSERYCTSLALYDSLARTIVVHVSATSQVGQIDATDATEHAHQAGSDLLCALKATRRRDGPRRVARTAMY